MHRASPSSQRADARQASSSATSRGSPSSEATVVRRDRLGEPPAEMVEEPRPPRDTRRERSAAARGAVEASQRLVPVAAHLVRLAGQQLGLGVRIAWGRSSTASSTASTAPCASSVCPRVASSFARRALSPAAVSARSASSGSPLASNHRAARTRTRRRSARDGPPSASANSRTGELSAYHSSSWPWSSTKRPRRASARTVSAAARHAERLAERGGEALERRDRPHEGLDLGRLVGEHLGGEVREERAAGPADARERATSLRGRHLAERLDREPHGRRPPAGRGLELDRRLRVGGARERGQQCARLARVEDEVGAGELEHLPLAPQALDRERQLEARGEDEVEPRRRLPAERLDHLHRADRPGDGVDVVDHEDEVAAQRGLERLAECRREATGAGGLVLLRTRACGRGDGAGGVDGERGDAQP